ncbi:PQQ-binding-like beta-propeller repeat protein [Bowmanella sp. Y26]|uniref:outer membrane protein assembly factor BamB family protein n=1 Tax=Bowmanella yangjiangensis TaxID=2811230 RepID=UPI001BDDC0BD|nr:PQQ-like beta-propeller repeat protein [Bowmanella yangjiangensis]MBT1064289.1 PQQ-binding-like beta-propeller repeat protein [Bowmanella yangjiangensis]
MKTLYLVVFALLAPLSVQAKQLWQIQAEQGVFASPLAHQDKLYLANGNTLWALDREGKTLWQQSLSAQARSTPAITNQTLLVHTEQGLQAFNLQGLPLWQHKSSDGPRRVNGESWGWGQGNVIDPWSWYRSSVTLSNGIAYYGSQTGTYAVRVSDGQRLWQQHTGTTHTQPAVSQGIVVVGSWNNHLYGLNAQNGDILWQLESPLPQGELGGWDGWQGFNLNPVISGDYVYVGSRSTWFFKLGLKDGREAWSTKHASSWIGSAALVHKDHVYYGLSDGLALIGQHRQSGNIEHLVRAPHLIFATPVLVGEQLYFATLSGELFSYQPTSRELTKHYQTQSSQTHYQKHVQQGGGPNYQPLDPSLSVHQASIKQVTEMLGDMDSIVSLSTANGALFLGLAGGRLLAWQP